MKAITNFMHSIRTIRSEKSVRKKFKSRFSRRTYVGLLRGLYACLLGRVQYEGD